MRGEREVGVAAPEVDDAQRQPLGRRPLECGARRPRVAAGRRRPAAACRRPRRGPEQGVGGVEEVVGPVMRRDDGRGAGAGGPVHLRVAGLGHPQLDDLVAGLDVPVAERLRQQLLDRSIGLLPWLEVAGRCLAVGGGELSGRPPFCRPPAGARRARPRRAPAPARRDGAHQGCRVGEHRPQPRQRGLGVRHRAILPRPLPRGRTAGVTTAGLTRGETQRPAPARSGRPDGAPNGSARRSSSPAASVCEVVSTEAGHAGNRHRTGPRRHVRRQGRRRRAGGAEFIPLEERHGRPIQLFWTWMSPNLEFATVFVGVIGVLFFGLTFWQAVARDRARHRRSARRRRRPVRAGAADGRAADGAVARSRFGFLGNILPAGLNSLSPASAGSRSTASAARSRCNALTGLPKLLLPGHRGRGQLAIAFFGHNLVHVFERYAFPLLAVVFADRRRSSSCRKAHPARAPASRRHRRRS